MSRLRAFTLIELLIVVAIIAILAAIAVPNFLEAQVRSKVSRVKADIRSLTTALEAYNVDHNRLPDVKRSDIPNPPGPPIKLGTGYSRACFSRISTPVAYITSGLLVDPFAVGSTATTFFGYANTAAIENIEYGATGTAPVPNSAEQDRLNEHRFVLQSVGPDTLNYPFQGTADQNFGNAIWFLIDPQAGRGNNFIYDPTNGTVSDGDVVRTGKGQLGG